MKAIHETEDFLHPVIEPLIHRETLKPYERLNNATALSSAVFTLENESVLVRNSFRWKKDGVVIADACSSMSMEQVCQQQGWRIVERYGEHLAIVCVE